MDLESIELSLADVKLPPQVRLKLADLQNASLADLKLWLSFRGDSGKADTAVKCRTKILEYMKLNRDAKSIDPTPERNYLRAKANRLQIPITEKKSDVVLNEDTNWKMFFSHNVGWNKILDNLPAMSNTEIDSFIDKSTKAAVNGTFNYTDVKKIKSRGIQFFNEKHLDSDTIYSKQNENFFLLKGKCSASKKQIEYDISVVIKKSNKEIVYVNCRCKAGDGGLCAHSYALMKTISMWSVQGLATIPVEVACTSKPCMWSQRKSLAHTDQKMAVNLLPIERKRKKSGNPIISTTLYDARIHKTNIDDEKINQFHNKMKNTPLGAILQKSSGTQMVKTKFGDAPIGSPLSYQHPVIDTSFNVTSSRVVESIPPPPIMEYPPFPLYVYKNIPLRFYTNNLDTLSLDYINNLQVDVKMTERIESDTRNQAASSEWHELRHARFTASKCYQLKGIKTPKGYLTLAKNLVEPQEPNAFFQKKFEYGRVNEPIALQKYEQYYESCGHKIHVESSGLVIRPNSFVLGATPDGRVIDVKENDIFGLVEIKCPQQYCDFDIADIAQVQKDFCLKPDTNGAIRVNKDHAYYDQIIMQMALTGTKWCDFMVYSRKGMVLDRAYFDQLYWEKLQEKIYDFYFSYLLPQLLQSK